MAVERAVARFGPPRLLARQWLRAWEVAGGRRVASARPATWVAFGWFGIANSFLYGLAMLADKGLLAEAALFRQSCYVLVVLAAPVLAGLATGLTAPARHALGSFYALAGLVLGWWALSGTGSVGDHLTAASSIHGLVWLPLGCGAAAVGGWLRGRWEATTFGRRRPT